MGFGLWACFLLRLKILTGSDLIQMGILEIQCVREIKNSDLAQQEEQMTVFDGSANQEWLAEQTQTSGNSSPKGMTILSQAGKPEGAETIMGPSRTDDGIVQTTNAESGDESRSGT